MNFLRNEKGDASALQLVGVAFVIILVLGGLGALISAIETVEPGYVGVALNKQTQTISPVPLQKGWNWVAPFVTDVYPMEIRVQKEEVDANAASSDMQTANTKIAVNFYVSSENAPWVFEHIGLDYKGRIIDPAIQEVVKASTAKFSADELLTKRETVRSEIQALLAEKLRPSRLNVESVSITNFQFSKDYQDAIEKKQTASQKALEAEYDLKRIEVEAKQRIAQAEGEAKAIAIQVEAITKQGGQNYIELKRIEKWNGVYPQYYLGGIGGTSGTFINIPAPVAATK